MVQWAQGKQRCHEPACADPDRYWPVLELSPSGMCPTCFESEQRRFNVMRVAQDSLRDQAARLPEGRPAGYHVAPRGKGPSPMGSIRSKKKRTRRGTRGGTRR